MAAETEYIRDYGLLAIFSNWSFQKNRSARKDEYANYRLAWASHLGGKRESYRVRGDMILTQNDIENHIIYPDATASMTWSIDLHLPGIRLRTEIRRRVPLLRLPQGDSAALSRALPDPVWRATATTCFSAGGFCP